MKLICEQAANCPIAKTCGHSRPHVTENCIGCKNSCDLDWGIMHNVGPCVEHKQDDSAISDGDRAWAKKCIGYINEIKRLSTILAKNGIDYDIETKQEHESK